MSTTLLDLALENVGPGPDPLRLRGVAETVTPPDPTTTGKETPAYDAIVVLFHRDHHCGNCRRQVRAVADRYDEFVARSAQVVSIVPEPRERVEQWQDAYELPYPICADPEANAGDAVDQHVRLGSLGQHSDLLGRMPAALVLDVRDSGALETVYEHHGQSRWDRPTVDDLLAAVEACQQSRHDDEGQP
ncbi:redoxin domain-containing protein [Natronosalvus vescus]|uniref:redoxin domain-containing protein n=1 Tax=Natronosalvus vescus TaxID=2953881 RepID=UPI002090554C|nr:redoxin domain-containing protein [Natronosalvus vescus]